MTVRPLHERFLEAVAAERRRVASRRAFLTGSAKLAGAGGLALLAARPLVGFAQDATPTGDSPFEDDVAVLNYALTLEHLEFAFYRDGIDALGDVFGLGPFGVPIIDRLNSIRDHEGEHVDTLTGVIEDLGGEPEPELEYDFGDAFTDTSGTAFLATAQALENTGVRAYDGAGQFLSDPGLLTAAGTIVAVEARHAAYLNLLAGELPFPAAFEDPASPDEVLEIAGPFIVS